MKKSLYGVHRAHCCKKHGCKYGKKDCPVVKGKISSDGNCEDCRDDDFFVEKEDNV